VFVLNCGMIAVTMYRKIIREKGRRDEQGRQFYISEGENSYNGKPSL
jgi:hypothetical protein